VQYNFDELINRSNTHSLKWDNLKENFGTDDVMPLWVADMDFRSPNKVMREIKKAASFGIYGYASSRSDGYYQSVINWVYRRHHWQIKKEWINHSPGIVPFLSIFIKAYTNPGDRIIIQSPVYYPFFEVIKENGCHLVNNQLIFRNGQYVIDFEGLKSKVQQKRVKLLILCSPHNPVGRVWSKEELKELGKICLENDILIISDEIHSDIILGDNKHTPFASISEDFANNSVTCISPSKTFNLAGLQTSIIIIPNKRISNIYDDYLNSLRLSRNNIFGLIATETAYRYGEEWLEQLIKYLNKNLEFLINYIKKKIKKVSIVKPEGTYLVWMDFNKLNLDYLELREFLIHKAKVALDDGYLFGPGGEGFERINIACSKFYLEKALKKIEIAIK